MDATFNCLYSNSASKIGTTVTRSLKVISAVTPDVEFDQVRKVSVDGTATARGVVGQIRKIKVEYSFPVSELALDDEFRLSAVELSTFTLDATSRQNIGAVLTCSMDPTTLSTREQGTTRIRSFSAVVLN